MKRHHTKVLYFDENHRRYGVFCLGSAYVVRIDDVSWPTDAHYLLAMRYSGIDIERIRQSESIEEARECLTGAYVEEKLKWGVLRDEYLLKVLHAKFTQHLDLEALLAETGKSRLVYKSREDDYDGIGRDGTGHNMFGRMLMRVRRKVRRTASAQKVPSIFDDPEWIMDEQSNDVPRLIRLAEICITCGVLDRATDIAYRAVRIEPACLPVRILLGRVLVARGQSREAVEHLRFVNRYAEPTEEVLRLLAEAYRGVGREVAAKVLEFRAKHVEQSEEPEDDWSEEED